jgi:hypothetical protein
MSNSNFQIADRPSELSLRILKRSLNDDFAGKGESPKNYAHRARVIRQQTELLARQAERDSK